MVLVRICKNIWIFLTLRGGVIIKKQENLGHSQIGGGIRKKTKKSQIQIRTFENRWGGSQFFKNVSILSYSQTPS